MEQKERKKEKENVKAVVYKSLRVLRERVGRPFLLPFAIDGEAGSLEMARLSGDQLEAINQILMGALPPTVKDEETGKLEYDTSNPEYQKRKHQVFLIARSVAVYWALPMLWGNGEGETPLGPPETSHEAIHALVMREKALGPFLDDLYSAVLKGGVEVKEAANFFSGNGFQQN